MNGDAAKTTVSTGSTQKVHPIPLERFLKDLLGTKQEVYSALLRTTRKTEKHTRAEWREILESLGSKKVTY